MALSRLQLFSIWETSFLSEAELDDLAIATFASICGYSFVLKTRISLPLTSGPF